MGQIDTKHRIIQDTGDSQRFFWIDFIRVIAAFAVVIWHVSTSIASIDNKANLSNFDWWTANFYKSSVSWCVPIFVLISGFILIDPKGDDNIGYFFRRRLRKILIPTIFWSAVYIILYQEKSLNNIIILILQGKPYSHLWYLYMTAGLYIFTPFINRYVSASTNMENQCLILFILSISSFYAYIRLFAGWNSNPLIFIMFLPYIGYYLCGYQIHSIDPKKIPTRLYAAILAICIFLNTLITVVSAGSEGYSKKLYYYFYCYFNPLIVLASVFIFLLTYKISIRKSGKFARGFIGRIARTTLGVYLTHPIFINIIRERIPAFTPLLSIPLTTIMVYSHSAL